MIVDSSVLVAIVLGEPSHAKLLAKLKSASLVAIGAPTLVETAIVLARRLDGNPAKLLARLLRELQIEVVPFTEDHHAAALAAFLRFGKGRHPAALNFGDCLSYAVASLANEPLFYLGEDFARAGIASA
jgi:ribonuclease VapC